jgi:DNA-binding NarL/FixJ family response regulator
MCIKIISVDDCQLLREGIKSVIDDNDDIELIGEAINGQEAQQKLKELKPDVVIMDINMPKLNGIEAVTQIRNAGFKTPVLILSAYLNKNLILSMLEAGANGYITKDCISDELINAIRAVHCGKRYLCQQATDLLVEAITNDHNLHSPGTNLTEDLTERECQMVKLVAGGFSSKQIACKLGISIKTVDSRRRRIREKLNLNSVADVTKFAIRNKLVELNDTTNEKSDVFDIPLK